MKNIALKTTFTLALLGTIGVAAADITNQVAIANTSKTSMPLSIEYQIAHKNQGRPTELGEIETITIDTGSQTSIPVKLKGYDLAGVVPISVNGHRLPHFEFGEPGCTVATSKIRPTGLMMLSYKKDGKDESIECEVR